MEANTKKRLLIIAGSGAVLILAVCLIGLVLLVDFLNPYNDATFDSTAWLVEDDARMAMSQDIVENHLKEGINESNVELLLGPAERILTKSEDGGGNSLQGHHTWTYYIGNDSFGVGDDVFIYIHFDASGQVVGSGIYGY